MIQWFYDSSRLTDDKANEHERSNSAEVEVQRTTASEPTSRHGLSYPRRLNRLTDGRFGPRYHPGRGEQVPPSGPPSIRKWPLITEHRAAPLPPAFRLSVLHSLRSRNPNSAESGVAERQWRFPHTGCSAGASQNRPRTPFPPRDVKGRHNAEPKHDTRNYHERESKESSKHESKTGS